MPEAVRSNDWLDLTARLSHSRRSDMRKPVSMRSSKRKVVGAALRKADVFVWASPYLGFALLILTIILPVANRADLFVGASAKREVSAARAPD